ncbi:kinase-like domain-containing protein [Delphinella strobiligena]|nr:kinase-like domain-containing protein [Delphinella strobiligena]
MSNHPGKKRVSTYSPPTRMSTMSLPDFRSQKPPLYWPLNTEVSHEMIEIKIGDNLEDPHLLGVEYLTKIAGSSGNTIVTNGEVIKANLQRELVAVKILTIQSQKTQEAFIRELGLLQKVTHPHIIAAIGSCSTHINKKIKFGILLFPLAETNLEDHLDKLTMTRHELERLLSFYPCLCHAVNYLHTGDKPIKHRDIKPSNILIGGAGEVILADFGISKQYDDKTKATTIRGVDYTVKYAPPHVQNRSPAGLEWDINCLGFVFLEMATVILGKTIENLLEYLRSLQCIKKTAGGSESTEIRFSVALIDGHIASWLKVLRSHAGSKLSQLPGGLASSRQKVDDFLQTIDDMMRTPEGKDEGVLAQAYKVFASVSKDCDYCRSDPRNRGSQASKTPLGYKDSNLPIGLHQDKNKNPDEKVEDEIIEGGTDFLVEEGVLELVTDMAIPWKFIFVAVADV